MAKTDAVPATSNTRPGSTMAAPSIPAAWSPAPAAMGVPAISPQSSAAAAVSFPITSQGGTIRGSFSIGMPNSRHRSSSQVAFTVSLRQEK